MENCFEIKKKCITTLIKFEGTDYILSQRPLTRGERLKIDPLIHRIEDEAGGFEAMMKATELRKPIDALKEEDRHKNKGRIEKLEYEWRQSEEFLAYFKLLKKIETKNMEANYQMVLASLKSHPFYENKSILPKGFEATEIVEFLDTETFDKLVENAKKLTYLSGDDEELVK